MFYADWCGHSVNFLPIWDEFAGIVNSENEKYRAYRIDVTVLGDVSFLNPKPSVEAVPTMLIIEYDKDGKVKKQTPLDTRSKEELLEKIKLHRNGELVIEKKNYTKLDGENIILDVNSEETVVIFKERFKKLKKTLVFYYARWCGYCQQMLPEWEKLEEFALKTEDLNKNFSIIRVDSEHFSKLGLDKTLEGYPTVILYEDGHEIEDVQGKREVNSLLEFLHEKAFPEKKEENNTNDSNKANASETQNKGEDKQPESKETITTKSNENKETINTKSNENKETINTKSNENKEKTQKQETPREGTENKSDNGKFHIIQKQVEEQKLLLRELQEGHGLINLLKEEERSIAKHKTELIKEQYEYKLEISKEKGNCDKILIENLKTEIEQLVNENKKYREKVINDDRKEIESLYEELNHQKELLESEQKKRGTFESNGNNKLKAMPKIN